MRKLSIIMLLVCSALLLVAVFYGYSFVKKRYGDDPLLASSLLDNCDNNLRELVRSPSSYVINKGDVTINGPENKEIKEAYIGKIDSFKDAFSQGKLSYIPLLVIIEFESSNAFGTQVKNTGLCQYGSLDFGDWLGKEFGDHTIDYIRLMSVGILDLSSIRNPYYEHGYDNANLSEVVTWQKFSDDVEGPGHRSIANLFKRLRADISTLYLYDMNEDDTE